jgi:hypothetical protein
VGQTAKWAGEASMKSKTRVFGVVYADQGIRLSTFTTGLAKYHGKVAVAASYPGIGDVASGNPNAQEEAPTLIAKMKSAGVTTIVSFADGPYTMPALTAAATKQDYFPEWVITGFGYQDINVVARLYDKQQMAHAFGLVWFNPYVSGSQDPIKDLFQWYWGKDKGTFSTGAMAYLTVLYNGIQLGGPRLDAGTFYAGLVAFPPTGGAYSNQVTTLESSYLSQGAVPPRGSAIAWWDPSSVGPSQIVGTSAIGPGEFWYMDGGKRYIGGHFPSGEPNLFSKQGAVANFTSAPPGEAPPNYTCTNCPSTGGGPAASSLGG